MVGKLLTERFVDKDVLKTPMIRAWKPTGSVSFKQLGPNLFLIDFQNWWDKDRILEGRPWTFDRDLFSLVDFNGLTPIEDLDFGNAAFWVRMYRLPLACMGREVGMQVGSTVGEVEDVDVLDDGVAWGEFLRVKIRIDLSKPLARGRIIKLQGKEIWVAFQYEKLPRFCFKCGVVIHSNQKCGEYGGRKTQRTVETEEFGTWLRVASPKRRFGHGNGWPRNKNFDTMHHDQSSGETMGTRSWRKTEQGDNGGRERQGWGRHGAATEMAQGEEGLFPKGNKFPEKEGEDYGGSDSGDFDSTAIGTAGQNIMSEGEENLSGLGQNKAMSDYGKKYNNTMAGKGKQTAEENRSMEGIMGSKSVKKFMCLKELNRIYGRWRRSRAVLVGSKNLERKVVYTWVNGIRSRKKWNGTLWKEIRRNLATILASRCQVEEREMPRHMSCPKKRD
jgi:hypothetical protein